MSVSPIEESDTFTFTINLKDQGNAVSGIFAIDGATTKTIAFNDGTATVDLQAGQSATIHDLPAGYTYEITEKDNDNYTSSSTNASGTIEKDKTADAVFTNTRKTANLSVSKTVAGNMGNRYQTFHFKLEEMKADEKNITGDYKAIRTTADNEDGEEETISFASDGTASFTLMHGETLTVKGLPTGTAYSVSEDEANQDGYITTGNYLSGNSLSADGAEASFTNTRAAIIPTAARWVNNLLYSIILCGTGAGIVWLIVRRKRKTTR